MYLARLTLRTLLACLVGAIPMRVEQPAVSAAGVATAGFSVGNAPRTIAVGSVQRYWVTITNTGASVWQPNGLAAVRLEAEWARRGAGPFTTAGRSALPAAVQPGKQVAIRIAVSTPAASGAWILRYQMVQSGTNRALQHLDVPVTVVAAAPASVCTGPSTPVACARFMIAIMNRDRARAGLPPYTLSVVESVGTGTCGGSYGHSVHMARADAISHDQFPRDICLSSIRAAGENVGAYGSGSVTNGLTMLEAMMMSEAHDSSTCAVAPNHACNILSKQFYQVGIGVYYAAGSVWLTEDFTD